jgi:SNF2 family DNA or RNA helicase
MGIFELLSTIYRTKETSIQFAADSEGLGLFFPDRDWSLIKQGQGSRLAQHQYLLMQLLLEQGLAQPIHLGIHMESDDVIYRLDQHTRETFLLPDPWPWPIRLETEGLTYQVGFDARLILIDGRQNRIPDYRLEGPLLFISEEERYIPNPAQWHALAAVAQYSAIPKDIRREVDNLSLIHDVLSAREKDSSIVVVGFSDLEITKPDRIGLAIEADATDGLNLTPTFGEGISPADIRERLGQITGDRPTGSIRVGKKIVLLDEDRMDAAREVIASTHIPVSDRKAFFENPTAWLDASLVDLDLGFSFRVRGAGPFRHAYFGETDESGISWFEQSYAQGTQSPKPKLVSITELNKIIRNNDDLATLEVKIEDAIAAGADRVMLRQFEIPIDDLPAVRKALNDIKETIDSQGETPPTELESNLAREPTVIDIEEYDEEVTHKSDITAPPLAFGTTKTIDYSPYARKPFPHQEAGISWLLSLAEESWCQGIDQAPHRGGLLADDMGLGKTFMSLVFVREYLENLSPNRPKGPVLVVAPLVLLENWRREIEATYKDSYFERVVMLQGEADLPRYRLTGARSELTMNRNLEFTDGRAEHEPELNRGIQTSADELLSRIKYALKVGKEFGAGRLDLPKSIVLTTYQTLRDYQFSLARVDWFVVIYDEAQNIKNPNAIQTRAAKALKAQFKLVVTGTPVENHLGDFWSLFDTLQPGFLGAYQQFRNQYVRPIILASAAEVRQVRTEVGKQLRDTVGGFMLRRVKEDHLEGLPEKHIILGSLDENMGTWTFDPTVTRTMTGEQLERYEAVISATVELMQGESGRGQAFGGLQRLRQVSLHPDLLEGGHPGIPTSKAEAEAIFHRSGKLQIVLDLLNQIRARNEKVIIFLIDKKMQQTLAIGLRQILGCEANVINGDTKTFAKRSVNKTRQGIIDRFESEDGFEVLIMSPVAAGVGLTITSANNVIHLERHWNPAREAQATDRIYRIGQTRDVNICYPILLHPNTDSFDVKLNRLLASKQGLKDAVIVPDEVAPDEMIMSGIFNEKFDLHETSLKIENVDRLNWDMFEALVAELYRAQGRDVILTQRGQDKGCDVVVIEKGDTCTLVQAKHTEKIKQLDGYSAISEVYGAGPHYSEALNKKVSGYRVITNASRYADAAIVHAKIYKVELIDRRQLQKMLAKTKITHSDLLRRDQKRQAI